MSQAKSWKRSSGFLEFVGEVSVTVKSVTEIITKGQKLSAAKFRLEVLDVDARGIELFYYLPVQSEMMDGTQWYERLAKLLEFSGVMSFGHACAVLKDLSPSGRVSLASAHLTNRTLYFHVSADAYNQVLQTRVTGPISQADYKQMVATGCHRRLIDWNDVETRNIPAPPPPPAPVIGEAPGQPEAAPAPTPPPPRLSALHQRLVKGEWPDLGEHWRILTEGEESHSDTETLIARAPSPPPYWLAQSGTCRIGKPGDAHYQPQRRRVRFESPGIRFLDKHELLQEGDERLVQGMEFSPVPLEWITQGARAADTHAIRRAFDVHEAHRIILELSGLEGGPKLTPNPDEELTVLAPVDHPDYA